MPRYEVKPILMGKFGETTLSTDDPGEAKQHAEYHAYDFYYGAAIIDTAENTADLGDRVVPVAEAFKDAAE